MTSILHFLFDFIVVLTLRISLDLIHLEHSLRQRVEVTSSNDVDLGINHSYLNCLEIMGEVRVAGYGMLNYALLDCVVDVELSGIFFHDVDVQAS